MDHDITIALQQLSRMRGMNAMYHRQFFSDVRFTTVTLLALFVAGAAVDPWIFLAVPFVALLGAMSTAFDASYLIFSRQFATRLEQFINVRTGSDVLSPDDRAERIATTIQQMAYRFSTGQWQMGARFARSSIAMVVSSTSTAPT